ncbi:hypothetical protein [Endozoicomonas numazuensis]|uniref:Uncharacterized protein n=1 Tax=Endozoicomonas numazuensis TaxID=1137799 RepID=A0A081NIV0_9GAMM|nr:hypothetical protein [Endozoicomonas numazuensis]KEQ18373.1 hypothetical protein GZ78_12785 [Endozoicomonas numazuensis]
MSTIIVNIEARMGSVVSRPIDTSLTTSSVYEQWPQAVRREIKSPVARCPDKKQKSFFERMIGDEFEISYSVRAMGGVKKITFHKNGVQDCVIEIQNDAWSLSLKLHESLRCHLGQSELYGEMQVLEESSEKLQSQLQDAPIGPKLLLAQRMSDLTLDLVDQTDQIDDAQCQKEATATGYFDLLFSTDCRWKVTLLSRGGMIQG